MKKTSLLSLMLSCAVAATSLLGDVVTLKDGSQISGSATGTAREIRVKTADDSRSITIDQVRSIRFQAENTVPASPSRPPEPPPATANDVTLPVGTEITIRTIDAIDSKKGDTFREYAASLDEPITIEQATIVPAKSNAVLKIAEIKEAGKLKGRASLALHLIAITANGQRVVLETGDVVSTSSGKGKTTARNGVIGTAAGCGLGAIVGGAIGCGVGGAIGGGLGAGASVFMGKNVTIAPETRLTFKLIQPVAIPVVPPVAANVLPANVPPASAETPLAAALKRGEAHFKANEIPEALKEYQAALDIDGRSSLVHYQIALVFFQQQNLQSAANEFRMALAGDLDPKWIVVWSHIRLGQIFDLVPERERAVNEYVQAVRTGDDTDMAQTFVTGYLNAPYQRAK